MKSTEIDLAVQTVEAAIISSPKPKQSSSETVESIMPKTKATTKIAKPSA